MAGRWRAPPELRRHRAEPAHAAARRGCAARGRRGPGLRLVSRRVRGAAALVAGVDEAGRGPLAGPVVAAAVILDNVEIANLGDSKTKTAHEHECLYANI